MKNKTASLLLIFGIYILAFSGAFLFAWLMKDVISSHILNLFLADVIATIIVFIFNLIYNNASIYDPYWSVQTFALIFIYYIVYGISFNFYHLIVFIPLLFWAIRLTTNWAIGFKNLNWVDWRYRMFRQKYPKIYQFIVFTGIMLMPTIFVFLGSIPLFTVIREGYANLYLLIFGGLIILSAAILQTVSDYQMKKFLKTKKQGEIINSGVWKFSRHPNYLAEIMIWWGVMLACLLPFNAFTLIGAFAITLMFIFISVPLMENHMKEKSPAYKEYQKNVSMLLPLPKVKK